MKIATLPIDAAQIGRGYHPVSLALPLSSSLILRVTTEHDDHSGAPWEECDGHGPVSDWVTRDKRSGERVLCLDRHGGTKRFYDYAEAIRIAKRDGWGAAPYGVGTKGERAARAVEADFQLFKDWCNDKWHYLGVIVELVAIDEDGEESVVAERSLWRIESYGDYWKEIAAELCNELAEEHAEEQNERAYWAARGVDTVAVG